MATSLVIEHIGSAALTPKLADAVRSLCDAAYNTATAPFFEALGAGEHLLGLRDGELVSHLMWVMRWLQPAGQAPLRTAYVEMVATVPEAQRLGYASTLLEQFVPLVGGYDVAALCPATDSLYGRLGWQFWRGPLSARRDGQVLPTLEERVMILRLVQTPALDLDLPLSVEWRPGEIW